jgi:hypothetical protein
LLHIEFENLNEEISRFRDEYLVRGGPIKLKRLLTGIFKLPNIARAHALGARLSRYSMLDELYYVLCSEIDAFTRLEEHLEEFWTNKRFQVSKKDYSHSHFQEELHKYLIYLQKERLETIWFISDKVKFQLIFLCFFQKLIQLVFIEKNLSEIEQKYEKIKGMDWMNDAILTELRQRGVIELIEDKIAKGKELREDFLNSKQFSIEGYFNLINQLKTSKMNIFPVGAPEHQGFESLVLRIHKIEKYYIDGIPIPEGFGNSELQELVLNKFAPESLKEWIHKQINQETFLNCWAQALLKRKRGSKKEMQKLLEVIKITGIVIKEQEALNEAYQEAEGKLRRLSAEASEIEDAPDKLNRALEERIRALICDVLEVKYTFEMEQLELLLKVYIAWVSKLHLLNAKPDKPGDSQIDFLSVSQIIDQTCELVNLLKIAREPFALQDIQVKRPENAMLCELTSDNCRIQTGLDKVRSSLSPIIQELESARKIIHEALTELKTQLKNPTMNQEEIEGQLKGGLSIKDYLKSTLLKLNLNQGIMQLLDLEGISNQLYSASVEPMSIDGLIRQFEERPELKTQPECSTDRGDSYEDRDEKAILELCLVSLQQRDHFLSSALNDALQSNDFLSSAMVEIEAKSLEQLPESKAVSMSPDSKIKSKKSFNQKVLQQKIQSSRKNSSGKSSKSKADSVSINVKPSDVLSESSKVMPNSLISNKIIQEDQLDTRESKEMSETKNIRKRTPETEKTGSRSRKQADKGILAEERPEPSFKELQIPRLAFKFQKEGAKGRSTGVITCSKSKFSLLENSEDARLHEWAKEIVLEFSDLPADDKDFLQILKEVEIREGKKERLAKPQNSAENIVVGNFKPQSNQLRDMLLKSNHWYAEHEDGSQVYIFKSKCLNYDQLIYSGFIPHSSAKSADLLAFLIDFRGRVKTKTDSRNAKLKRDEKSTRNGESKGSDKQSKEDQDSVMKSKSPVGGSGFKLHDSRGVETKIKRLAEDNSKISKGRRGEKRNHK